MKKWRYELKTHISRNFDPEIEGTTLDSIMDCCKNILNWKIPSEREYTRIVFDLSGKITPGIINYLEGQLKVEFENDYFCIKRIKPGERDSGMVRNI